MPLTPNVLLQAASQAKTQAAPANPLANVAEPGDKASSFAQVYAKQSQNSPASVNDAPVRSARDKGADAGGKKDAVADKAAAPEPEVADSGNTLPADKPGASDDTVASDDGQPSDAPLADAAPADPSLDPSQFQVTQPAPLPDVPAPVVEVTQPEVEVQPVVAAAVVAKAPALPAEPDFDPEADPLDALPAVRLAMEQGGHVSASSQVQPKAAPSTASTAPDGELTSAQNFTNGMASMLDVQASKDSTEQGGDKAFSGLIDDGLKDLKGASSDTRVDDFANRLAALTQAATPKTTNVVPVNQPLAMHQSGWSEEVVNRVMYLSSVNLKSADIQLQPAELGRLDIRVNMIPDQQTQVTFMSAHAGVREALEGQMHRMREMFNQQGLGQVDVNVSDQNRGWQGQEQAQQGQNRSSGTQSGGVLDAADEELPQGVAEIAAAPATVIGSSAVDYYA